VAGAVNGRAVDPVQMAAAHAEYKAGVPYRELVKRYGWAKHTLLRHFRALGLRGGRGRQMPAKPGSLLHGPGRRYGAYIEWLLGK
jgi:hypothetical protein